MCSVFSSIFHLQQKGRLRPPYSLSRFEANSGFEYSNLFDGEFYDRTEQINMLSREWLSGFLTLGQPSWPHPEEFPQNTSRPWRYLPRA